MNFTQSGRAFDAAFEEGAGLKNSEVHLAVEPPATLRG